MKKMFHKRQVVFDDIKSLNAFTAAYDRLFSNGGAHTNRMSSFREEEDAFTHKVYYILPLVCDSGTWNYIKAFNEIDRITIYQGVSYLSKEPYVMKRSYLHFV